MKKLQIYDTVFEAEVVRGLLESEGITAVVLNEYTGQVLPFANMTGGGLDMSPYIAVANEDFEKACEILQATYADKKKTVVCPECGSDRIAFGFGDMSSGKKILLYGVLLPTSVLSGSPIGKIRMNYHCKECKHGFK